MIMIGGAMIRRGFGGSCDACALAGQGATAAKAPSDMFGRPGEVRRPLPQRLETYAAMSYRKNRGILRPKMVKKRPVFVPCTVTYYRIRLVMRELQWRSDSSSAGRQHPVYPEQRRRWRYHPR